MKEKPFAWLTEFRPEEPYRMFLATMPPTANHIWKTSRDGHHYLTPEGAAFKEMMKVTLFRELPFDPAKRLYLRVKIGTSLLRGRDLDNYVKVLLDGLCATKVQKEAMAACGYIIPNDAAIDKIEVERFYAPVDNVSITVGVLDQGWQKPAKVSKRAAPSGR